MIIVHTGSWFVRRHCWLCTISSSSPLPLSPIYMLSSEPLSVTLTLVYTWRAARHTNVHEIIKVQHQQWYTHGIMSVIPMLSLLVLYLVISCISMRAAAITPGSGSLREALNSACRWETVVGEMSWKWCIANSAFLRTSSLCEQWSWYYHHWSAKIANYQYWSMSTDHISLYWSHWSISITTNPYWSSLIGINHH